MVDDLIHNKLDVNYWIHRWCETVCV